MTTQLAELLEHSPVLRAVRVLAASSNSVGLDFLIVKFHPDLTPAVVIQYYLI